MSRIDKAYNLMFHPFLDHENKREKAGRLVASVAIFAATLGIAPAIVYGMKKHRVKSAADQEKGPVAEVGDKVLSAKISPRKMLESLNDKKFGTYGVPFMCLCENLAFALEAGKLGLPPVPGTDRTVEVHVNLPDDHRVPQELKSLANMIKPSETMVHVLQLLSQNDLKAVIQSIGKEKTLELLQAISESSPQMKPRETMAAIKAMFKVINSHPEWRIILKHQIAQLPYGTGRWLERPSHDFDETEAALLISQSMSASQFKRLLEEQLRNEGVQVELPYYLADRRS